MTDVNKDLVLEAQTQTIETEEEKEVKRELALKKKIAELKKDEAISEMFKIGLEEEVRSDPRLLEGAAWDIKKKEYAKKVLDKMKSAESQTATDHVIKPVNTPAPSSTANQAATDKTFSPKEKTDAELKSMGWNELQIAQYRAYPV